jgi:hypothetical protein
MVSLLTLCAAHHVFDTHSRQLNTKKLVFVATLLIKLSAVIHIISEWKHAVINTIVFSTSISWQYTYMHILFILCEIFCCMSMELTLCKQLCLGQGTQYAGIQNNACFCLNDTKLNEMTTLTSSECSSLCPGNIYQYCGTEQSNLSCSLDHFMTNSYIEY